jgi:hypothetical protein
VVPDRHTFVSMLVAQHTVDDDNIHRTSGRIASRNPTPFSSFSASGHSTTGRRSMNRSTSLSRVAVRSARRNGYMCVPFFIAIAQLMVVVSGIGRSSCSHASAPKDGRAESEAIASYPTTITQRTFFIDAIVGGYGTLTERPASFRCCAHLR